MFIIVYIVLKSRYDLKRLEAYASNVVDYHMVRERERERERERD